MEQKNNSSYRYERKVTCSAIYDTAVTVWLHCHDALFHEAYPARYVNNIYLDTIRYDCYQDNLSGAPDRYKARIRWYGDLCGIIDRPVLEFKIRKGEVGTKKTYELPLLEMAEGINLAVQLEQVFSQAQLPENVMIKLSGLRPSLINRYLRRYYQSARNDFRLTLDNDLGYYPVDSFMAGFLLERRLNDLMVIELKYAPENNQAAAKIMQSLPVRVSRHSKYVNGLQLLYP